MLPTGTTPGLSQHVLMGPCPFTSTRPGRDIRWLASSGSSAISFPVTLVVWIFPASPDCSILDAMFICNNDSVSGCLFLEATEDDRRAESHHMAEKAVAQIALPHDATHHLSAVQVGPSGTAGLMGMCGSPLKTSNANLAILGAWSGWAAITLVTATNPCTTSQIHQFVVPSFGQRKNCTLVHCPR